MNKVPRKKPGLACSHVCVDLYVRMSFCVAVQTAGECPCPSNLQRSHTGSFTL